MISENVENDTSNGPAELDIASRPAAIPQGYHYHYLTNSSAPLEFMRIAEAR